MVLIEVDRNFDSFHRLLGSHAWSEFLQKPSKEELEKVSKVFGCTYNTGRKVEKHGPSASRSTSLRILTQVVTGWKRVNIKDDWFNGWRRENEWVEQFQRSFSSDRISASSDTHTLKPHTVTYLLKRRPARQCASLSRKRLSLTKKTGQFPGTPEKAQTRNQSRVPHAAHRIRSPDPTMKTTMPTKMTD